MPRAGQTIADTALSLIHQGGPQHLDALVPEIVARSLTRAKDPRRAVAAAIEPRLDFIRARDGRWCSLADQLDGAIFTRRPTALERRHHLVLLTGDLWLVERHTIHPRPSARGGEVHLDFFGDFFELPWIWPDPDGDDPLAPLDEIDPDVALELVAFAGEIGMDRSAGDTEILLRLIDDFVFARLLEGPPAWLPPLAGDELLGIMVRGGAVDAVAIDPREIVGRHVRLAADRVARLAHLVLGPDPSWFAPPTMRLEDLLELVATEAPDVLRRPLPPLSELIRQAGFDVDNGLLGHQGTDWAAAERWLPGSGIAEPS